MMGSQHEVNAMGSAFLLAAANDRSAEMLAEPVIGFLRGLPEGIVTMSQEDGSEAPVTEWETLVGILVDGTDDEAGATLAA